MACSRASGLARRSILIEGRPRRPTALLKNAFDSAYLEWIRKPSPFLGYGGVRAIEQLRDLA